MAKLGIIVELDADTVSRLAVLGKPSEVLEQLACSAADGSLRLDHALRERTDESLQVERTKTDAAIEEQRTSVERAANEVVVIARQRADEVLKVARQRADAEHRTPSTASNTERERREADAVLEDERSKADAVLEREREREREERRRAPNESLAVGRKATNADLGGERARADTLILDQREANETMVLATIRAQDFAIEADEAKVRAEESERELRAVSEFREMFIGILGHDLRNPLGAIVMAAGAQLGRGRLGEQDAAMATRIIGSSRRMSRMISQVLDLTRARLGGGLPIEATPTDLREICENIVGEFEAIIQLEVEGDVTGTWDQDRLAEVLSNLTGNAVGYATPGTAVIVKAHADGPAVVVEVSNQGVPIPADVLPFIFEPFRRADQRAKSATGSLGLGLYIAKQIVFSHGGTLDAHSADGTTTFVMRIPRGDVRE